MKNSDISCNVIVDLLPLYKEEICSEETKVLVEEHLAECADCRRISEQVTVPEVGKKEAPTENETFKKVGKKLKKSRFTKVMSVLMCICLVLFAGVNGAWYFLSYRPMKRLCGGMERIAPNDEEKYDRDVRKVTVYSAEDDKYQYIVFMPRYLEFSTGGITVSPKGAITIDGNGMTHINDTTDPILRIAFYNDLFSDDTIFVGAQRERIFEGQESREIFGFRTDTDFNFIMESYYIDNEKIAELREFINTHRDELNDMKKAAQNKWGDYLNK
ncbi:MAG: zf-HC2 domain-containing protein [Ruminococcus sp.]|uniref:zf-HC2 domain-containing protein n=1 Tax=Ruminococcus sp. TaxID=41978 RepID=UPI0025E490B8|nr:zf-HC2 domain-containing protein [Ruminococcus sp.]MBR5683387.1 zf-HC2 domain-containing protein [Ruminococcus sp.]